MTTPQRTPEIAAALLVAEGATPRTVGDALRAMMSGRAATSVITASVTLFEAGGKRLLDEGARSVVRNAAERGAERALAMAAGPLLGPVSSFAKAPVRLLAGASKVASPIARVAARAAGKEILKGAGKAAGIGLVIDGAVAGIEAIGAVRGGSMDAKEAATYVAKEAATGAVATGAGVLLGAGLVAVTGGLAAPVVFAASALGAIGTKRLLRKMTTAPTRELTVRTVPST